ncbi:SH3 domain-containing protein [Streptomyces sp. NBC_00287]|uniref:SH3 domain-containing protein n=1 Tax=Streptomyces sp. NBC_00287 TaxID=2975702 RepID=UPI002E2CF932|nr:SH3 domain-containing protein [Streptomyces sp. NBC_00287]
MSLRSRLAITVAAGALAAGALATPAVAGDDWESSRGDSGGNHQEHHPRLYKGVVTANTLLLRSAPNRGGQVIRTAHRGEIVKIFCKTVGQNIQGNPLWYLLTDGTWAWGSARFINNIGPAPRWC